MRTLPSQCTGKPECLDNPEIGVLNSIFSSHKLPSFIGIIAALCLPCAPALAAVGDPAGGEFQVNTYTQGNQQNPSAAMNGGGFIVVWESSIQDTDDYSGIYAQRYDATGAAVGGEFRLNTATGVDNQLPKVVTNTAGNFVVVWESIDQNDKLHIYYRRLDATGTALGNNQSVTSKAISTSTFSTKPSVAMDAAGNFVVAWENYDDAAGDEDIYARRFDANGTALGAEFRVNATTENDQTSAQVAMDAAGAFVVTWQSTDQDGDGEGIYAQVYDATGTVTKGEFRVNTVTASDQTTPAVAMNADGFVVAWESLGQDGDGKGIYAQRYDAFGGVRGGEFRINAATAKDQSSPAVAMNANGFVVAWDSLSQSGAGKSVYAKRYDAVGTALGDDFQVNTTITDDSSLPAVAINADDASVLVWQSLDQDSDGYGVYAQRYLGNSVAGASAGGVSGSDGGGNSGGALDPFSVLLILPALWRRRR